MAHKIIRYLKFIKIIFSLSFQKMSEYRVSFALTVLSTNLWILVDIIWLLLIFEYTDYFAQYTNWQYFGFIGIFSFVRNLFHFIFHDSVYRLTDHIYDGKIDTWITKPLSSQFLASFVSFNMISIANIVLGLIIFIISLVKIGAQITLWKVLLFVYIVALAVIFMYSFMFSLLCLTFWLGRLSAFNDFLSQFFDDPAEIPTMAYKGVLKFAFYFIIPIVLVATLPTSVFYFGIDYKYILYYSVFVLISFAFSRFIWNRGLRVYSSVSS
ncbi:ABC transporter permease [Patescibacteria group bacterium]